MYGISQSPTFHKDALIVQFDQAETSESRMLWINPLTGEDMVSLPRDYMANASWASPILAETDQGLRVLTACDPFVVAYDPETREEVWRANAIRGDVGPSPIYADGLVYTTNDMSQVAAIQTGGSGDVTETHIKWTALDGVSDAPSPICDGKYYLQTTSAGWMTCWDAKSGEMIWEHDLFQNAIWPSFTLVGDTVYLPSTTGPTFIFKLADEYEEIATARVGEKVFATPAFMDGRIYLRGENSLFCIGKAAE